MNSFPIRQNRYHFRPSRPLLRFLAAVLIPIHFVAFTSNAWTAADISSVAPSAEASKTAESFSGGKIEPRRTVSDVAEPPQKQIADYTDDDDFFRGHLFADPLVARKGKLNVEENKALAKVMNAFSRQTTSDDFSGIERFLEDHSDSRWSISLLSNLATSYFKSGYFTKALETWERVWSLGKGETDPDLKPVVDDAVAHLAKMNARIGRFDRLETLFGEIGNREIRGSAAELVVGAKDALWLMKNQPQELFRCGPLALGSILAASKGNLGVDSRVDEFKSTAKGTSLAQVANWAKQLGLNYQIARREVGASVITPSVVHWKVGHFAAIPCVEGRKLHVQDPTFAEDLWIGPAALDMEASGYFLVPAGKLPSGWSPVSSTDAKEIWGKGGTAGNDPDRDDPCDTQAMGGCGSCGAMARYNVHAMLVSLNITDTPVFYRVSVGPSADFTLTYNQRESHQPATFDYANFGNKWTCNFVSYITDNSTSPSADAKLFVQGGGAHTFKAFNSGTSSYAPEYRTQAVLVRTSTSPISYELRNIDGSKQVFSVPTSTVGSGRKVFLKQTIDPAGNAVTYSYSGQRIIGVTDAAGLATTIEYKSNTVTTIDYYRIGKVTNPFGKFATFDYNAAGRLSAITDMIGIQSAFEYGSGDFISKLTTPYGATTFAYGDSGTTTLPGDATRWVEITDPLGAKERVEYRIDAPGFPEFSTDPAPPTMPSPGAGSYYLGFRNTFYWSKKAMMEAPGDYTKAKVFHWLHSSAGLASGTLESEKEPLENRVYYLYKNQSSSTSEGPNELLVAKGRKLDDGTTRLYQYDYNNSGRVTKKIDPSTPPRVTTYKYDTNGIDLTEVYQQNPQGASVDPFGVHADKIAAYAYNNIHEPLTSTDASGQTTTNTYNPQGQLRTVENPKHEITTRTYDPNTGYLMSVTGPMPGSTLNFTYDDYGRQQTMTDSEGYTITSEYDALNRVTKVSYPDGTYEQIMYNRLDPEWKRDRLGRWTHNFFDALQHLTGTEDPALRFTRYNWCTCGSLESIVDPDGNKTSWTRDGQSRVISKTYSNSLSLSYAYENATSRLKFATDAKNQRTNYSYFADDNLKQISYTNVAGQPLSAPNIPTPSVSYTFDSVYNRIGTMSDGTGLTSYAYNPVPSPSGFGASMLASIDGPLANDTITYGYDELGRAVNRSVNGGANAWSMQCDALGRIQSVTTPLGTFNYAYVNTTRRVEHIDYPNGQKTHYSYFDNVGDQRLQQIKNLDPSSGVISQFDYTYNAVGNIIGWTQTNSQIAGQRYDLDYDPTDQLRGAALKDTSNETLLKQYNYDYDDSGNRTIEQIDSVTTTSWPNSLNQLIGRSAGGATHFTGAVDEPAAVTINNRPARVDASGHFDGTANLSAGKTNIVSISATDANGNSQTNHYQVTVPSGADGILLYDLDGNLINDGSKTYEWDAANRCAAINQGTHRTEFTYDGFSRESKRVEKDSGAVTETRRFIWRGLQRCELRDESNSVIKRYYPEGVQVGSTSYYYTRDHLESVRELTDSSGTVHATYDYDPYGRRNKLSGDLDADLGFTGHYVTERYNDLVFAPFRVYSTDLGRWISRDPVRNAEISERPNLYTYTHNDPVNYLDVAGKQDGRASLTRQQTIDIIYDGDEERYNQDMRDGNRIMKGAQNLTVDCMLNTVPMPKPGVGPIRDFLFGEGLKDLIGNLIKGLLPTYQGPPEPNQPTPGPAPTPYPRP